VEGWECSSVVESLPSTLKALGSTFSIVKNKIKSKTEQLELVGFEIIF
jgi:hypothetical protein